jgi:Domain of Unknown Function with PDB structure (DUF3857)
MIARFLGLCFLSFVCFSVTVLAGDDWKPIDAATLAVSTPKVEKDADAEALFWEVHVLDEVDGGTPRTVLNHYLRIKIFTDRGRESQSRIDIPYLNTWSIKDVAARTIKPNGTILELRKEDVFDRTIVKGSGLKLKAKSFVLPGVEAGAIIEYRWKEVHNDQLANYIRLQLQRDIPVQLVTYYLKPLINPNFPFNMRLMTFHAEQSALKPEKDGFYSATKRDVPAFHEEVNMPPEDNVRPWMLIYYAEDRKLSPDQFWKDYGKQTYEKNKSRMKVSDEVRQAAVKAIGDVTTPEEKLDRLFEFCRHTIKNLNNDSAGLTAEDREKAKDNKSPADTLKRGVGTGNDIDMLFASLAIASGFEARIIRLGDRSDMFVDKSFPNDYFLHTYDIAVLVGDKWHFYDPASTYVPEGMLRWQEEGEDALLSDPKEPVWIKTPLSAPDKSKQKRIAKLRLSEDGTLEGDVTIEYSGHFAVERKNANDGESPAQREQTLIDDVKARMSTSELTEIKIDNINDPVKPFVYAYHVRVPGYAQRTGKRIFLQPAFFQHGLGPRFGATERRNDVYFHYPWSEEDEVAIELPAGYRLDNADAPGGVNGGAVSQYAPNVSVTKDGKSLIYQRKFYFGAQDGIVFPISSYTQLKTYFDVVHREDNHAITLKQTEASSSN